MKINSIESATFSVLMAAKITEKEVIEFLENTGLMEETKSGECKIGGGHYYEFFDDETDEQITVVVKDGKVTELESYRDYDENIIWSEDWSEEPTKMWITATEKNLDYEFQW